MDKVNSGLRPERQFRYRTGSTMMGRSPNSDEDKAADYRPGSRKSVAKQKATTTTTAAGYNNFGDGASLLTEPDPADGGYVCSGKFPADFARLCAERGVPYTPEVVCRTSSAAAASVSTAAQDSSAQGKQYGMKKVKEVEVGGRGKKLQGKMLGPRKESSHALSTLMSRKPSALLQLPNQSGFHPIPSSLTRITTTTTTTTTANNNQDSLHFFKPRIQVELEVADDERTVTEVHIRGWRVDAAMMGVLARCWAALPGLHTLQLWNTALDLPSLALLGAALARGLRLTTLVLDNNPLAHLPLASALLSPTVALENLSLRWCGITDAEVKGIALALGSPAGGGGGGGSGSSGSSSSGLLSLNLCGNCVGDVGAGYLAEGLKLNRSLLVLNLSSNRVSSVGAAHLAEALSWFRVGQDLQEARKVLVHAELTKHTCLRELPRTQACLAAPKGAPRHARGVSLCQSGKAQPLRYSSSAHRAKKDASAAPGGGCGKEDRGRKDGRPPGKKQHAAGGDDAEPCKLALEVDPAFRVHGPRVKPSWFAAARDREVLRYGQHPLLQAGFVHQGDLWLPGNRTLVSLNLSRNRIGERGVEALLRAVKEQSIPLSGSEGRGLMRLALNLNVFSAESEVARALSRIMLVKDPSYRVPSIDLGKGNVSPCAIPVRTAI